MFQKINIEVYIKLTKNIGIKFRVNTMFLQLQ